MLLGLALTGGEKRLLEALLKTCRHLETKIGESAALVEKLYEESREAQLIRTIPGLGKYLAVLTIIYKVWKEGRNPDKQYSCRCDINQLPHDPIRRRAAQSEEGNMNQCPYDS